MKIQGSTEWTTRRIITLTLAIAAISQPLAGHGQTYFVGTYNRNRRPSVLPFARY